MLNARDIIENMMPQFSGELELGDVLALCDSGVTVCWGQSDELSIGLSQLRQRLQLSGSSHTGDFFVTLGKYDISLLADDMAVFYGTALLKDREDRRESRVGALPLKFSAVMLAADEKVTILHAHVSASLTQAAGTERQAHLGVNPYYSTGQRGRDLIFEWDIVQDTVRAFTGLSENEGRANIFSGSEKFDIEKVHPADRASVKNIAFRLGSGLVAYDERDIRIAGETGAYVWYRLKAKLQNGRDGKPEKVTGMLIDIHNEKIKEEILVDKAERDGLTGLYNKNVTEFYAKMHISKATPKLFSAFIMIDIDDFKLINDSFGHLGGDVVLSNFARGLKTMFREEDVVGRIGGDEFAVVMCDLTDTEIVERKMRGVLEVAGKALENVSDSIRLTCSVGVALAPQDGTDWNTIYQHADRALYYAKSLGKNTYAFYDRDKCEMAGAPVRLAAMGEAPAPTVHAVLGDSFAEHAIDAIYSSGNPDKAITQLLANIGEKYGVRRVRVFENDRGGSVFTERYKWSADKEEAAGSVNAEGLHYYGNFDTQGTLYCPDVMLLDERVRQLFGYKSSSSLLQKVMVCCEGYACGFVSVEGDQTGRLWTRAQIELLEMAAKIICIAAIRPRG